MGGFAAKFRGFRVGYGRGAVIQRTADSTGVVGRKNFLKKVWKKVKNPKIGVREGSEGGAGVPYIGRAGRFLGTIFRSRS